jgi:hypothetical protein
MKRAVATFVGTILVLVGAFALVVGIVLLTVFGLDGRSQAEAARAVASSSAVVMDPQRADAGLPGSLELTTFTLSASAVDRGATFVGIGPADDVLAYLSGSPYDVARGVDGRSSNLDQVTVDGSGRPLPPGSQSFWAQQTSGIGTQQLVVPLGAGEQLVVVMNPDGSTPVDVRLVASVEAAWIGPAGVAASAGGSALLLIGLWLLLGRRSDGEGSSTAGGAATEHPTIHPAPSEWGPPIAVNDVPAVAPAPPPAVDPRDGNRSGTVAVLDLTTAASVRAQRSGSAVAAMGVGAAGPQGPPREPGT